MELDSVNVVPSPICRPGSDCWDVEVYFFYPERQVQTVRRVYRFTVDVSDTVPVTMHMKMNRASICPAKLEACCGQSGKSVIAPVAPCES